MLLLFGAGFPLAGVFMVALAKSDSDSAFLVVLAAFFLCIGLYMLACALRSRLIIDGTRIEVRGALKENTADLSEIEGFRTVSTRNGSYTQLILKQGRGKITVSQSFDTDDIYRAWFQHIVDLDAQDRDALLNEISQDAELGATPEERLSALKQAKAWNIFAIVVAIAAAAGLNFAGPAPRLPSAVALALAPVAALMMMQRSPLLYTLFKKKADPRADLGISLIFSGIGMALRISDLEFVSMQPLLLLIIVVAVVYIVAFYSAARKNANMTAVIFGLLFAASSYSFGLAIVLDTVTDNAKVSIYAVPVTGKHLTSGKSTTYYLELAPWGPLQEPNKINVSSSFYDEMQAGDQVCLGLHPGRLRASWYQLTDCPAQPAASPTQ